MKIRLTFVAALAAVVAAVTGYSAPSALACSGDGATCHGVVDWTPAGTYTGGLATLRASRMSVAARCWDFVNHEMWVGTDTADVVPFGAWVEAGLKYGYDDYSGTCNFLVKFWGEWNTQLQAVTHVVGAASLNTDYNAKISHSGSGSWGVYFDGTNVGGSSSSHGTTAPNFQVGGEATISTAQLSATASNLQKRSTSNSWSYGWGCCIAYDGLSNPFSVSWISSPTSLSVSAN